MSLARSVAYDPAGGLLVAGSGMELEQSIAMRTGYRAIVLVDGTETVLQKEADGVMLLLRPSTDGARISSVTRAYEPMLVALRLP